MKHLREMAKVLIVDSLASMQENDECEVLKEIDSLTSCGGDLMDTVPSTLQEKGVDLEVGIMHLLPEMERLVDKCNELWGGKLTLEELASEFGDTVFCGLAMSAVGMGSAMDDDSDVDDMIKSRGCEAPHGEFYVDDGLVSDACYLIIEKLQEALEKEAEA